MLKEFDTSEMVQDREVNYNNRPVIVYDIWRIQQCFFDRKSVTYLQAISNALVAVNNISTDRASHGPSVTG